MWLSTSSDKMYKITTNWLAVNICISMVMRIRNSMDPFVHFIVLVITSKEYWESRFVHGVYYALITTNMGKMRTSCNNNALVTHNYCI